MGVAENIDLQQERQRGLVSSEEFAEWWAGGAEKLQKRRKLEKVFFDNPEFDDPPLYYLSHKEYYEHTVVKATKFLKRLREWLAEEERQQPKGAEPKTLIQSMYDLRMLCVGPLGIGLFQQTFPLRLHMSMFLPTLLGQGTEEQQQEWLHRALKMDGIVGTYAQTELGHGTFIRGLETRADYDAEREEFTLNTPTLTAYKWWPGGLGQTANMVVVMAQLYVKGKHCGLQPFLVRIRNAETHLPEPGVDVGEIGAPIGANNGFLGFKNVRIPRKQMLMKNAQVLPDGTFVKGETPVLTYGTMVFVRVTIVKDVSFGLLQAATIATRYSAVRHQSQIELHQPERQIIDHVTQQAKLFPNIAKGVFFCLAADHIWAKYHGVMKELAANNRRNLPELHSLTCCLKAVCSAEADSGIETLRKSCGGNGYLSSANFWSIHRMATAAYTYEGEYTVLLLQTARFLLKHYENGLKRIVLPTSVTYLRDQSQLKWRKNDTNSMIRALEITATALVRKAFDSKRLKRKQGHSDAMSSNLSGIKLTKAAEMHGRAYLARISLHEVNQLKKRVSPALATVLQQLLELFILDMFLNSLADVLLHTSVSQRQVADVQEHYEMALTAFRNNAINVVDGFDFHDRVLGSTLGCRDGRIYERLMEEAAKSPLNQEPVNRTFESHLKPLMSGKL